MNKVISIAALLVMIVPASGFASGVITADSTARRGDISRTVHLSPDPSSQLWLEGGSTLHDYTIKAEVLRGSLSVELGVDSPGELQPVPRVAVVQVSVPIDGMHSDKEGLDERMRKALRAEEHPAIQFVATSVRLEPTDDPSRFRASAPGTLTVAGVDQPFTAKAEILWVDNRLSVQGQHQLLMKDFDVKPPKMFLGALRTHNEVLVHFDLLFSNVSSPSNLLDREALR